MHTHAQTHAHALSYTHTHVRVQAQAIHLCTYMHVYIMQHTHVNHTQGRRKHIKSTWAQSELTIQDILTQTRFNYARTNSNNCHTL